MKLSKQQRERAPLNHLRTGDAVGVAIRSLLHSIRGVALNLKSENMGTAKAYYETDVNDCLETPASLCMKLQTVQAAGINPAPADKHLIAFMTNVACAVAGIQSQPTIQQPTDALTSVTFSDGIIKMESSAAVAMQSTTPLTSLDHVVIFTALGWGANIVQDMITSAHCCSISNPLAQFIRKNARLLSRCCVPETWCMGESEHQIFWNDLRDLHRMAEVEDSHAVTLRAGIGEFNGRHPYPDIHGFVNEQTVLLDVTGKNSDLCVSRHHRAESARPVEYFPVGGSVIATWVTFCMCDPLVFLSAFAQIHAPLYDEEGDWISPELPLSEAGIPCGDEWELPEVYSIRHAAS